MLQKNKKEFKIKLNKNIHVGKSKPRNCCVSCAISKNIRISSVYYMLNDLPISVAYCCTVAKNCITPF